MNELLEFQAEATAVYMKINVIEDQEQRSRAEDASIKIVILATNTYYKFCAYCELIIRIEKMFQEMYGKLDRRVEEIASNKKETENKLLQDDLEISAARLGEMSRVMDDHYTIQEDAVTKGIVLSAYNLLEDVLNQLCKIYKVSLSLPIAVTDIKGAGIERASTYLTKIVGLTESKTSNEWFQLTDWNNVRNAIVHKDGLIEDERLRRSIGNLQLATNQSFDVNSNERIEKIKVTTESIRELLIIIDRFLSLCVLRENSYN